MYMDAFYVRSVVNRLLLYFCLFIEVLEYCKVLDLDHTTEKDMLYIAREGIKAPLPKDWKPM